jgi:hypothetical protein
LSKAQQVLPELRALTDETAFVHSSIDSRVGAYRARLSMLPAQSVGSERPRANWGCNPTRDIGRRWPARGSMMWTHRWTAVQVSLVYIWVPSLACSDGFDPRTGVLLLSGEPSARHHDGYA